MIPSPRHEGLFYLSVALILIAVGVVVGVAG